MKKQLEPTATRTRQHKQIVCVDLDGTLCDDSRRYHLTPQIDPSKTWADYHMACADDLPLTGTVITVRALAKSYAIHIVSGREEQARPATIAWLQQHDVPYDALRLRGPEDITLKNWEHKVAYITALRESGYEPVLFIEDWPMVATLIEEKTGVPVMRVHAPFPKLYEMPRNRSIPLDGSDYPPLTEPELNDIAYRLLRAGPLDGYPSAEERLYADNLDSTSRSGVKIPEGPWHVANHNNHQAIRNKDTGLTTPQSGTTVWSAKGYTVDQLGRPLHPYWKQLLSDKRIGLPTGKGMFYDYGPNKMVDAVVYRWHGSAPEFLLVRHKNSGKWGLPGGFVDIHDDSLEATARREVTEETGLPNIGGSCVPIWRTLPIRQRDTLHAWADVTLMVIHGDPAYIDNSQPIAGSDVNDAQWLCLPDIAELEVLDTHSAYIALARRYLRPPMPVHTLTFKQETI
jgi:ADP-ribose pyrophosphatase YjhB (NUDIX family)/uncharacterized HAD superfamily protein